MAGTQNSTIWVLVKSILKKYFFHLLSLLLLVFFIYSYRGKISDFFQDAKSDVVEFFGLEQKPAAENPVHDPELVRIVNNHAGLISQLQKKISELEQSNKELKTQTNEIPGLKALVEQLQEDLSALTAQQKKLSTKPALKPKKQTPSAPESESYAGPAAPLEWGEETGSYGPGEPGPPAPGSEESGPGEPGPTAP